MTDWESHLVPGLQSDQVQEIPGENKLETKTSAPQTSILVAQVSRGNRLGVSSQEWRSVLARSA